ncbi:family 78 glycoside hydrolase catalytic domain [Streptomyces sp. SL54]|uniref:alpha-L-rhamnosidase n=1 Tax=Streptantibioticus silvisoli TaxID=2705255 RepID=A0ABT6W900_9ACTN|nr:family 78 glycoside hydrolase catalytic domain [Streptantibioticus silvisoli]MDI5967242.1 family 78 glycoside hydrolase catalytic domain [Streptantibioticus silvisoli]
MHITSRRRSSSRGLLVVVACLAVLVSWLTPAATAGPPPAPVAGGGLRVDDTVDPPATDTRPSLGWTLRSGVNGERQTAYRVLVATRPDLLDPRHADVWDSGRTASANSTSVPYGGPSLRPVRRYYWKVQVWDAQGRASAWSSPARWGTGPASGPDWKGAQWISPDTGAAWSDFTLDTDFTLKSAAASVLFRAKDASDYYLWQINSATTPGKVMLRPQLQLGGNFSTLGDIDLSPVLTRANVGEQHHLRIEADGSTITTWIDGTQVDTRTNSALTEGTLGFRTSTSDGVAEDSLYDNLVLRGPDGSTLFSDDFSTSPDPSFPATTVSDGQLNPQGDPVLLDRGADAPMLRRTFTVDKQVAHATAYVYGLGFYELHLNGGKVGDQVLTPADSPYGQRDLYDTYDVTGLLHQGTNAVGIWLGNGYGANFSPYGFRWLGPQQAIMLLDVTYTDGTRQDVTTDPSWKWSNGPITANDIYNGESYDARLDQPGWDTAGFDDTSWQAVRTVPAPSTDLEADTGPAVRVVDTLRPVKLTQPRPGVWIYDLGQDIAGWERLRVTGPAGTTVRMRTAEELDKNGDLDTTTNRAAAATDRYTLAGTGGVETYEPRFTYHGFRYVEVTGYPGTPTLDSLDGRVVHADVASTASFSSSDPLLDRIWRNNRWSILNNSMSVPTDNPVRDERTPPGMDVQAYHDASTTEFAMDAFYAEYLQDMPPGTALPNDAANAQQPDMGGDQVTLAWTLYQQYGDRATLAAAYPAMKTFVDTNATDVPDHIWPDDHGFGDWCPPDHGSDVNGGLGGPTAGGNCTSEVSVVNTALSYLQASDVALAARALGDAGDATHFTGLADSIKQAFNTRFLNADNTYGDGRQVTSVLPLAFGMVPSDRRQAVGDRLADTITVKDGGHLDTGIFGTRYLVDALASTGHIDTAMTALDQTGYPGFGYEIGQGATSSWEEWLYSSSMETHDHAMFAGVNASLDTELAGIRPTAPGYRTMTISPRVPAGLHHVSASLDTVRGRVTSSWTSTAGAFRLSVTVPVNATATVDVPLPAGRHGAVRATSGAKLLHTDGRTAVYAVGSGTWQWSTR